jgi:hypothetical protein
LLAARKNRLGACRSRRSKGKIINGPLSPGEKHENIAGRRPADLAYRCDHGLRRERTENGRSGSAGKKVEKAEQEAVYELVPKASVGVSVRIKSSWADIYLRFNIG